MRTYIVKCDSCSYKKIVQDPNNVGLPYFGTTKVQGRIPKLNEETGKVETFEDVSTMPKYKCPGCGRVVTLRKLNAQVKPYKQEESNENNSSPNW